MKISLDIYLKVFFELVLNKKLELNTGPFAKFVGEVIEIQKNKIKLLVKKLYSFY